MNDGILTARKNTWYDCLDFDCGAFDGHARAMATTFIMAVMLAEYGTDSLSLIKDPRLCLLLDLWLPTLHEMRVSTAALLVLCDPCEVIASLAR